MTEAQEVYRERLAIILESGDIPIERAEEIARREAAPFVSSDKERMTLATDEAGE